MGIMFENILMVISLLLACGFGIIELLYKSQIWNSYIFMPVIAEILVISAIVIHEGRIRLFQTS